MWSLGEICGSGNSYSYFENVFRNKCMFYNANRSMKSLRNSHGTEWM